MTVNAEASPRGELGWTCPPDFWEGPSLRQVQISGVRFQYFVLRFGSGSLKNRGFRFGFAKPNRGVCLVSVLSFVLFCFSSLSVPLTHFNDHQELVSFTCLGLTLILYNHCGWFIKMSFIDLGLLRLSIFAIFCTDGVKAELKDGFIKHHCKRQMRFHKKKIEKKTKFQLSHAHH